MPKNALRWLKEYGVFFSFFLVTSLAMWWGGGISGSPENRWQSLVMHLAAGLGAALFVFGCKWLVAWLTGLPPHY